MADSEHEISTSMRRWAARALDFVVGGEDAKRALRATISFATLAAVAVATFVAWPALPDSAALALLLFAVVVSAIIATVGVALGCALAGTIFFTLIAGQSSEAQLLARALTGGISMGGTALILGFYAKEARSRAAEASQRASDMAALYHLSRKLSGAANIEDVAEIVIEHGDRMLGCQTILLLKDRERDALSCDAIYAAGTELSERDFEAARAALELKENTGQDRENYSDLKFLFMPLTGGDEAFGVIGFCPSGDDSGATLKENLSAYRLTGAFVELAGFALAERFLTHAVTETAEEARLHSIRSDVLTSLAHDLNSPLSAIIGSSSSMLQYDAQFDRITRLDLVATIYEEAQRLNRLVRNLLHLTEFEGEGLNPRKNWIEVSDLIASSVKRAQKTLDDRTIEVRTEENLPLIQADFVLSEQAIYNLLENAAKYSESEDSVQITADLYDGCLRIRVRDSGIGISAEDIDQIFERHYRSNEDGEGRGGSGLGLTIARAIVEAHDGKIDAQSMGLGHGSTFSIMLPVPEQPETLAEDQETK